MPSIGTCFRFYAQMRVEKKTKLLPIKLKTVYTTVHSNNSACYMKLLDWSYDQINFSLIYVTNSSSRMKLVLLFLSFLIINEILAKKSGHAFVAFMQNHLNTEDGDWAKLIRWIFFKTNYVQTLQNYNYLLSLLYSGNVIDFENWL